MADRGTVLIGLGAVALGGAWLATRTDTVGQGTSGSGGPGAGFSPSDIRDLRDLNDVGLGGFRAGTRAGMVDSEPDDYEPGDALTGL